MSNEKPTLVSLNNQQAQFPPMAILNDLFFSHPRDVVMSKTRAQIREATSRDVGSSWTQMFSTSYLRGPIVLQLIDHKQEVSANMHKHF